MRKQRLVLGTCSVEGLGRKLPVCSCHVCLLCLVLRWRFVLVAAADVFSQELWVRAENRGASGQGLGFQGETKRLRELMFWFQLLSASTILSPPSQFKTGEERDDSRHKTEHGFKHASSNLLPGMFQS